MPTTAHKPRKSPLTLRDLVRLQERSGGYGYLGHSCRTPAGWLDAKRVEDPYVPAKACDEAVLAEANRRGWDVEALFAWADSRAGRHCGDALQGAKDDADRRRVVAVSFDAWAASSEAAC